MVTNQQKLDHSDGSVQVKVSEHNWKDGCRCQECFSKTPQQWTVEPVPATVCALCSTEITKWSPTDFCKECEIHVLARIEVIVYGHDGVLEVKA